MTNKTKNEIEKYIRQYCWANLPGDQTWSNSFYDCVSAGYEFGEKEFKKKLRDKYNALNSRYKDYTKSKMSKHTLHESILKVEYQIELLKELMDENSITKKP